VREIDPQSILHTQEEVDTAFFGGFFYFEGGGFWICRPDQRQKWFAFPKEFDPRDYADKNGGISIVACARWLQGQGLYGSANILLQEWQNSFMGAH